MSFKGARPAGQPRTLRSIAEDKGTTPAGREGAPDYDANAGVPMGERTAGQRYRDEAEAARPAPGSATKTTSSAEPRPTK